MALKSRNAFALSPRPLACQAFRSPVVVSQLAAVRDYVATSLPGESPNLPSAARAGAEDLIAPARGGRAVFGSPRTRNRRVINLVYTFSFPQYNAETYFSTEQSSPRQGARISETHEDGRWPRRSFAPTRTGPQEADCQLGEVVRITNECKTDPPVLAKDKAPGESESGFPKSVRLLRSSDFRKVYDNGVRYSCPLFAAFCLADPGVGRAVGFTTPKALGKAVKRNRIRRRVREAARLELASLSEGWSIVFNPRRKVLDCIFTDLQREVKRLFIRCAALPPSALPPASGGTSA
jgi:ribonuclease P protein component